MTVQQHDNGMIVIHLGNGTLNAPAGVDLDTCRDVAERMFPSGVHGRRGKICAELRRLSVESLAPQQQTPENPPQANSDAVARETDGLSPIIPYSPLEIAKMDAWHSYMKNCGPRAAERARDDLLGEALEVCKDFLHMPTVAMNGCDIEGLRQDTENAARAVLAKATGEGGAS